MSDGRFINYPLLLMSYSALFLFGLIDNGRGPAFPRLMESLSLDAATASWMFTCASLAALLCGLASHYWMRRLGPVRGFGLFFILMGLGALTMALSPSFPQHGHAILIAGSIVFGAGGGGSGICMNTMVGKAVSHHYLQKAYGALHTLYGVSSFSAPLLINLFVWMGFDWRLLFYISCGLCLLASVMTFRHPSAAKKIAGEEKHQGPEFSLLSLSLALMMAIYVAGEVLLSSRLALYLESARGLDKIAAANYLSYFFAGMLTGRFLTIISPIPLHSAGWPLGLMLAAAGAYQLGGQWHPAWLCLAGLLIGPVFPIILTWLKRTFGERADGIIPTAMNGVSVGVISMHFIVGKLSESQGIGPTFTSGPILFVASFVLLATIAISQRKA